MLLTHMHLVPFIVLYTSLATILFCSLYSIFALHKRLEDIDKFEREHLKPGSQFEAEGGLEGLKTKLHAGKHS